MEEAVHGDAAERAERRSDGAEKASRNIFLRMESGGYDSFTILNGLLLVTDEIASTVASGDSTASSPLLGRALLELVLSAGTTSQITLFAPVFDK